jgi:hypothetical protein
MLPVRRTTRYGTDGWTIASMTMACLCQKASRVMYARRSDHSPIVAHSAVQLLIIQNLAPILLSSVLATFILGLACAQAYAYACSARYRSDHLVLRASVAIVILINIAALAVTWAVRHCD